MKHLSSESPDSCGPSDSSEQSTLDLRALDARLQAIRDRMGDVPPLPEDEFEAMFRNRIRAGKRWKD